MGPGDTALMRRVFETLLTAVWRGDKALRTPVWLLALAFDPAPRPLNPLDLLEAEDELEEELEAALYEALEAEL